MQKNQLFILQFFELCSEENGFIMYVTAKENFNNPNIKGDLP